MTRGAFPCRDQTSASEPSTYWLHRAWKSCKKRSFSTFPPCLLLLLGKRGFSWLPSVTNHSEREHLDAGSWIDQSAKLYQESYWPDTVGDGEQHDIISRKLQQFDVFSD